jgi:hydrogenase maturation factor
VVNYVVPTDEEYEVATHFLGDQPKDISNFKTLFADKLMGCTLRLIKMEDNLSVIKLVDQVVLIHSGIKIDKIDMNFSKDGRFLTIFSKLHKFIKVYESRDIEQLIN